MNNIEINNIQVCSSHIQYNYYMNFEGFEYMTYKTTFLTLL